MDPFSRIRRFYGRRIFALGNASPMKTPNVTLGSDICLSFLGPRGILVARPLLQRATHATNPCIFPNLSTGSTSSVLVQKGTNSASQVECSIMPARREGPSSITQLAMFDGMRRLGGGESAVAQGQGTEP